VREEGFDGSLGGSAEDDDVVVIGVVFVWGFVAGDEDTPGVEESYAKSVLSVCWFSKQEIVKDFADGSPGHLPAPFALSQGFGGDTAAAILRNIFEPLYGAINAASTS